MRWIWIREEATEGVETGSNPTKSSEETVTGENEVVMETLNNEERDSSRVTISVSHEGHAEKMRPLTGAKMNIRTHAQKDPSHA